MSESAAKKITKLDDLVQGDHLDGLKSLIVASTKTYAAEELFEVRFGETRLGPIWNQDLKAYVAQDPNFPVSCHVSQFASDDWMPLLQHPFFQRRKPQLVSSQQLNSEDESYYVLSEGRKHGPYSAKEVQNKLMQGDILVSDEVSTDGGHSWGRLYEIEEFDRRTFVASGELPFMPEWQVFNNSFDEVERNLGDKSYNSKALETDAIASLAYLENLQSGKAPRAVNIGQANTAHSEEASAPFPVAIVLMVVALGAGLALAAWFASQPIETTNVNPTNKNTPAVQQVDGVSRPVPSNRLGQDVKREENSFSDRVQQAVKKAPPTNSGSFRKSRAFRNNVVAPSNNNDFNYDNDRPLEQDPIGSKLSRESINPDDDYQQELREEGALEGEVDLANDRFTDTKQSEEDFAKLYENEGGVGESGSSDQVDEESYDSY